ncbi:hypothetical protein BTA51_22570 [Hahella sp. CCB-MM4]|uniref:hypothetical protein n=1 Tax=Hahella sp. (strain CCB-MM4) TaxID=1926491 RepID=UPI000BD1D427|nr:hypothetical protein [Hahella sp. CCB-MM4]OZG71161.1 hypothetical protein BTA51_22570 [Hahella sp. CCB-MM4]
MHDNQRWTSRALCLLLLFSGVFGSMNVLAARDANNLLEDIHQARLQAYLLLTDYYNFSANAGDKQLMIALDEGKSSMDSLVSSLSSGYDSPEYLAALSKLQEHWVNYKALLERNIEDIKTLGYHELQLVFQLAQLNVDVGTTLGRMYQLVSDQQKVVLSDVQARSRRSAYTMAVMMTKYAARSTSNISQVFQGEDPEETLDILASEFDRDLQQLLQLEYADASTLDLLRKAQIKWNFIRNSYMNYNENNVNFVVNRYSRQIIESLDFRDSALLKS